MNIRTLAFIIALLVTVTPPSAAADLAKAEAGRYAIDKSHAKVVFAIALPCSNHSLQFSD